MCVSTISPHTDPHTPSDCVDCVETYDLRPSLTTNKTDHFPRQSSPAILAV